MIRVKVKSKMMGCREVAKVFESLSLKAEDLTGQSFNLTKSVEELHKKFGLDPDNADFASISSDQRKDFFEEYDQLLARADLEIKKCEERIEKSKIRLEQLEASSKLISDTKVRLAFNHSQVCPVCQSYLFGYMSDKGYPVAAELYSRRHLFKTPEKQKMFKEVVGEEVKKFFERKNPS